MADDCYLALTVELVGQQAPRVPIGIGNDPEKVEGSVVKIIWLLMPQRRHRRELRRMIMHMPCGIFLK